MAWYSLPEVGGKVASDVPPSISLDHSTAVIQDTFIAELLDKLWGKFLRSSLAESINEREKPCLCIYSTIVNEQNACGQLMSKGVSLQRYHLKNPDQTNICKDICR